MAFMESDSMAEAMTGLWDLICSSHPPERQRVLFLRNPQEAGGPKVRTFYPRSHS